MTQIFKINELKEALSLYKKSDIISFPTDTVYGIGANIYSQEAIMKIYNTKHRPLNKPLAVLCANKEQILEVVEEIPTAIDHLIKYFLPGPLTVILPKKTTIPHYITSNLNTIGVRIPNHPVALEILKEIGPLATTSANFSGDESINNGEDVIKLLGKDIDIIIDGGLTTIGIPSTVVAFENGKIKIYREGVITENDIKKSLALLD
ncbi:MAG TPA: L-threonylcarbamoyladenylate synthase [Haloplasmataceae bacterium]